MLLFVDQREYWLSQVRVPGSLSRCHLSGKWTDMRADRDELRTPAMSSATQLSEGQVSVDDLSDGRTFTNHRFTTAVPLWRHAGQADLSADVQLPGGVWTRVRSLLSIQRKFAASRLVSRGGARELSLRTQLPLRSRVSWTPKVLQQRALRR